MPCWFYWRVYVCVCVCVVVVVVVVVVYKNCSQANKNGDNTATSDLYIFFKCAFCFSYKSVDAASSGSKFIIPPVDSNDLFLICISRYFPCYILLKDRSRSKHTPDA